MGQTDNSDDDNVIKSLVMLDALKKTKNVRAVVINELRRIAAQTDDMENKCVLLAAADLLEDTKKKLKNQALENALLMASVLLLMSACASEQNNVGQNNVSYYTEKPNIVRQWERIEHHLSTGKAHFKTLVAINDFVNGFKYKSDLENYGVSNYWVSPKEFFAKGSGQCQDYAIAKYALALEAGFTTKTGAKLELVFDRRKQAYHMVLIIKDSVLDNQNKKIISVDQAKKRYDMLGEVREVIAQSRWH